MGREGGRTTGKRQPHRQWVGAATKWGQGGTERGRQGREGAGGGGCCAAWSETEREERDWAVGLYLALPRPDGWRVTAAP